MPDQIITIPSRGRPDVIKKRTLQLIDGTKDVYVIVEPKEFELYKNELCEYDLEVVSLPKNNMGLTYSRRFISDYFKEQTRYIWQLDDNLDQLLIRNGLTEGNNPHLDKIEWLDIPAQQVFDETLEIMKEHEYIQMTLSFRPSNWYFDGLLKENTRAWGIVLNDNHKMNMNRIHYDLSCKLFQDLEIVAQILSKGFVNATYHKYAFHKKMAGYEAGCSDYRTQELANKVCEYLTEKYNDCVKIKYNKKHDINEPSFKWNRIMDSFKKMMDSFKNGKLKIKKLWEY